MMRTDRHDALSPGVSIRFLLRIRVITHAAVPAHNTVIHSYPHFHSPPQCPAQIASLFFLHHNSLPANAPPHITIVTIASTTTTSGARYEKMIERNVVRTCNPVHNDSATRINLPQSHPSQSPSSLSLSLTRDKINLRKRPPLIPIPTRRRNRSGQIYRQKHNRRQQHQRIQPHQHQRVSPSHIKRKSR